MSATTKVVASILTGVLTVILTYYWRSFPLRLAAISALSVAVLTYMGLNVSDRLRRIYRR